MSDKFEQYEHHGTLTWVRQDLKGKHAEHCLCWSCARFHPESRDDNCPIANVLYRLDIVLNITTPVWECPLFEEDE